MLLLQIDKEDQCHLVVALVQFSHMDKWMIGTYPATILMSAVMKISTFVLFFLFLRVSASLLLKRIVKDEYEKL